MTEVAGLKYRPEEWQALANKWDRLPESEREYFKGQMTRPQWRRFERLHMKDVEGKRTFEKKLTTREDVMQLILLYDMRLKIHERIEVLETRIAFLQLPWHRRARVGIIARWTQFLLWLESKGIRLVKLEKHDGEGDDRDDSGARGDESGRAGDAAEDVHSGREADRLPVQPDSGMDIGEGEGSEPAITIASR